MEEEPMSRMLQDPNTLLETDAGAHLTSLCNADFPRYLLAHWVREKGILMLEEAVARLTSRPAGVLGLSNRDRLQTGCAVDVVVFDPQRIRGGQLRTAHDLPAQQPRLVQQAVGYVIGQSGSTGENGRFVYLCTAGHAGTVVELSEAGGAKAQLFRRVADAAREWEEPILSGVCNGYRCARQRHTRIAQEDLLCTIYSLRMV